MIDSTVVKNKIEKLGLTLASIDLAFLDALAISTERDLLNKTNLDEFNEKQNESVIDIIVNKFLAEKDMASILSGVDTSTQAKAVVTGDTRIELGASAQDKMSSYCAKKSTELEKAFIRRNRVIAW